MLKKMGWSLFQSNFWRGLSEKGNLQTLVKRVNTYLLTKPEIQVSKIQDNAGTELHWYVFAYQDQALGKRIRGSGFGYSDQIAIVRAWGEFVERYSFVKRSMNDESIMNSSGFASHTSFEKARQGAVAELVERDVLLCCWLLRIPAVERKPLVRINHRQNKKTLHELAESGFRVKLGLFGRCMNLFVGIAFVYSDNRIAIATAAKVDEAELHDHLIRECASMASDFLSKVAPTPISSLSEIVEPLDHLRFHLEANATEFLKQWLSMTEDLREFPSFDFGLEDLTPENPLACSTGYAVVYARSENCQNLWFGPTKKDHINLARLKKVAQRELTYEEINFEPHPLA